MTQNINTTSPSDNSEQPIPPVQVAQPARSAKTKSQKNLYEPYLMPLALWRVLRWIVRIIIGIVLDVHVVGSQNVPAQGAAIIASNHLSWADVPLIPAFLKRRVVYMAKEEAFQGKIGLLVRFFGAFPVKRGEADRQSIRAADELLKAGQILGMFPEGTRSKIHQLGKAHAGLGMVALRSGVPIIPVAIQGSENTFKKFRPRVTITIGEPMLLKPKGKKITREDIDEATDLVMWRIASMLPPAYRGVYARELPNPEDTESHEDTNIKNE